MQTSTLSTLTAPRVRFRDPQIEMAHGAGGKASRRLVEGLFAPLLLGSLRRVRSATPRTCTLGGAAIAITTDSFVVSPLRFPGGSIGELAVNGTVNDLAVSGARADGAGGDVRARGGPAHPACSKPRSAPWRDAARARRRHDRRRRHQGRRARQGRSDVHHHDRDRTPAGRRRPRRARRYAPATASCCPGRSAITASRFSSPAASSTSKPISDPTRARCSRWSRPSSTRPGPASAGCATPPAAASPPRSTSWRATAGSASCI